jgi:hypothetical protein
MYRISAWAKQHIWPARTFITFLHFALIWMAIWISEYLSAVPLWLWVAIAAAGYLLVLAVGRLRLQTTDKTKKFRLQKFRFLLPE